MAKNQIEEFVQSPEAMRLFQQERLILDATERICGFMEEKKMTRKALADSLGTSKSFITQLLDGSRNMTLRTLSDVFLALGFAVQIHPCSLAASIKSSIEFCVDLGDAEWADQPQGWGDLEELQSVTIQSGDIAA
jgi:transcriptional regulator with XRE-family HTH domain